MTDNTKFSGRIEVTTCERLKETILDLTRDDEVSHYTVTEDLWTRMGGGIMAETMTAEDHAVCDAIDEDPALSYLRNLWDLSPNKQANSAGTFLGKPVFFAEDHSVNAICRYTVKTVLH